MTFIGYHASHEQFTPEELMTYVQQAEKAGFTGVMCSDHLAPWNSRQGESGFCWSWLGAALQATSLSFGSLAIPCGWRYHPVIVAQAAATLAQMFPGRFPWVAVGSGEALNEKAVGYGWPDKSERQARLKEGVDIMRALWRGETVNSDGLIKADHARLWTLPGQLPRIIGAALTPETAGWMGGWADGLITINQPSYKLEEMVNAFRKGGGAGKPLFLQVHVSWAESDALALQHACEQWYTNILPPDKTAELSRPEEFEEAAQTIKPGDMHDSVLISSHAEDHIAWLQEFSMLGFDAIYIHNTGINQTEFINFYRQSVLPGVVL